MKHVDRSELLALGAYEEIRERFRARIIAHKKNRRVAVGPHMTFVFEDHDTVLFQIQEMLRTERITNERAIAHELETYNELIPDAGQLSATLLIEYADPAERAAMLEKLIGLREHIELALGDRVVDAIIRPMPGEDPARLPAIHYVRFPVGDAKLERVTLRVTHPAYLASAMLEPHVVASLARDLDP